MSPVQEIPADTIYGSNAAYVGSGDVSCFKGDAADNTLVSNAVLVFLSLPMSPSQVVRMMSEYS